MFACEHFIFANRVAHSATGPLQILESENTFEIPSKKGGGQISLNHIVNIYIYLFFDRFPIKDDTS